jgi:hypothetical protein
VNDNLFLCAAFSLVKVAYEVNYKLNYNPNRVLILNSICLFLVRSGRGGRRFESSHPDQNGRSDEPTDFSKSVGFFMARNGFNRI